MGVRAAMQGRAWRRARAAREVQRRADCGWREGREEGAAGRGGAEAGGERGGGERAGGGLTAQKAAKATLKRVCRRMNSLCVTPVTTGETLS